MITIPLPLIISVQGFQGFLPSSYLTQGHPKIDRRIRPLVTLGISLISSVVVAQIWQTLGRIRNPIAVSLAWIEFQKTYGGLENR